MEKKERQNYNYPTLNLGQQEQLDQKLPSLQESQMMGGGFQEQQIYDQQKYIQQQKQQIELQDINHQDYEIPLEDEISQKQQSELFKSVTLNKAARDLKRQESINMINQDLWAQQQREQQLQELLQQQKLIEQQILQIQNQGPVQTDEQIQQLISMNNKIQSKSLQLGVDLEPGQLNIDQKPKVEEDRKENAKILDVQPFSNQPETKKEDQNQLIKEVVVINEEDLRTNYPFTGFRSFLFAMEITFTIVLLIVGAATFLLLYENRKQNTQILRGLELSWDSELIVDMNFVSDPDICDFALDYDDYLRYYWGGSEEYCLCNTGAIRLGECQETSKSQAFCVSEQKQRVSSYVLNMFQFGGSVDGRLCARRIPGFNYKQFITNQVEPGSACPSGQTLCGDYLCIPSDQSCPITEFKISASQEAGYTSREIISGSLYILYKTTQVSTESPLVQGTFQTGGGVCLDQLQNSVLRGQSVQPKIEVLPRALLSDCGESTLWTAIEGDQETGELTLARINRVEEDFEEARITLDNNYKFKLYQRSYVELNKECQGQYDRWRQEINNFYSIDKNWDLLGGIFSLLLIVYILACAIGVSKFYANTTVKHERNFSGFFYGIFLFPGPKSLNTDSNLSFIYMMKVGIIVIIWISLFQNIQSQTTSIDFFKSQKGCGTEIDLIIDKIDDFRLGKSQSAILSFLILNLIFDPQVHQIIQTIFLCLTCQLRKSNQQRV